MRGHINATYKKYHKNSHVCVYVCICIYIIATMQHGIKYPNAFNANNFLSSHLFKTFIHNSFPSRCVWYHLIQWPFIPPVVCRNKIGGNNYYY